MFEEKATLCCISLLIICLQVDGKYHFRHTQDQTTSRANTLFDDADDIQRQLDNEIRDRLGMIKTAWVFHIPTISSSNKVTGPTSTKNIIIRIKRKNTLKRKDSEPPDKCGCAKCKCKPPFCDPTKCEAPAYETTECVPPTYESPASETSAYEPPEPDPPKSEKPEKCEICGKLQGSNSNSSPKPVFWDFNNQMTWKNHFNACGGHSQSPVDLPTDGLTHTKGSRGIHFSHYKVQPDNLTLVNDGKRLIVYGHWKRNQWPLVYGGAAHSRRYLFHSMSIIWPSEHTVGGLNYPIETQLLHISAEYNSFEEAVKASSSDPQAFLGIVNIFKYTDHVQKGMRNVLKVVKDCKIGNTPIMPMPLSRLSPSFKEYVCYHGSLTTPPCTEAVLWLIRRKSLPMTRAVMDSVRDVIGPAGMGRIFIRMSQPLNDRKIYLFI